jgi:putative Mg2+ transporter-C (MgtC) family protein
MNGMTQVAVDAIRTDPTHMAQGIMTGIGSYAQEVIFKEGVSVRPLAATIWLTRRNRRVGRDWFLGAACPLGSVAMLAILAGFRVIGSRLPSDSAHHLRLPVVP